MKQTHAFPLTVTYCTVKPIAKMTTDEMPIPDVGDEVEIEDVRYVVQSRVWTLAPYTVAIHVTEK